MSGRSKTLKAASRPRIDLQMSDDVLASRINNTSLRERPQRPNLPRRQTSLSKRHASFDSPSEVPFPRHGPFLERDSQRTSPAATNVECKWKAVFDNDPLHASLQDRSPLLRTPTAGHMSPVMHALSTNSDDLGGQDSMDVSTPNGRTEQNVKSRRDSRREASDWDSEHLRPQLLHNRSQNYTPAQGHPPLSPTSSTYYDTNQVHGLSHARTSSESLPLPKHSPICSLPPLVAPQPTKHDTLLNNSDHAKGDNHSNPPSPTRLKSRPIHHDTSSSTRMRYSEPTASGLSSFYRSTGASNSRPISTPSDSTGSRSSRSSGLSTLPPPTPPTIHTPPPPPLTEQVSEGEEDTISGRTTPKRPPHEQILSNAPPPVDSYIAVETADDQYRLIVRLPGYKRDSITLAVRRHRILHVVADSWEAGGGHFERRISFGYDADLVRVRAEFDGEHLRVIVPRKPLPPGWSDTLS